MNIKLFLKNYKHGPLARTVLGQNLVQGIDYAYTLQGWLKGINSTGVGDGSFDIGQDGKTGSVNNNIARDVFGISLNYFNGDYKPVGLNTVGFAIPFASITTGNDLFNGNIKAQVVSIPKLGDAMVYSYNYDQLNRLTKMAAYSGLNNATNIFTPVTTDNYKEIISYDANGNIQTYLRNGITQDGSPLAMDNMTYHYKPNTNQLDHVTDAAPTSNYSIDIDNQNVLNYTYDQIGNLTKDAAEGITAIMWNVYGKITDISKSDGTKINYTYDPTGNRISKTVNNKKTFYVRDASGNVMSVYVKDAGVNGGDLSRTETHLYGSSRLGMSTLITNVENPTATHSFVTGLKVYEGTNHLGNVLITFSDKKIAIPKPSPYSEEIDYYVADVVGANDYYPFGMALPGRTYSSSSLKYRYGFNGKENDNEVKGEGNQQDYGMRISDPRLGKFLSVDPLSREFSWNSSYSYSENSPIAFIDLDGAEKFPYQNPSTLPKIGTSKFYTTTQGSSAEIFKIQEFGKTYNITKITVYEQSKDAFGRIHHFNNYYFVQDNALVNEEDQPTQSGTTFKTKGTNWHYYLSENNGMSRQFKQTSGVGEGLGTAFFCGALAVAAIPTLPYVANALVNTGGFTSAGASEEIGKRIETAGANAVIQGIQIASGKQSSYNVTSTLGSFLTANHFGGAVWTTGGELLNNQSMTFEGTLTSFAVNAGGNFLGNVMTKNVGGNIGSINPLTNAKYSFLGSLGGNSAVMINETYKDLNTKLETP